MKTTLFGLALLTIVSPAIGATIFSDDFEAYTAGSANRYLSPYVDVWPDLPGSVNRYPVETAQKHSGVNSLLMDNVGYGSQSFGISHELGGEYQATDADPLIVSAWVRIDATASRRTVDVYVEMAKDDVAPTTSGTSHDVLAFAWPYSVRSNADTSLYVFDGTNWNRTGTTITAANTWQQLIVTIKSTTIDITVGTTPSNGWARTYAGTFDQINLRHVNSSAGVLYLDDVEVSGGVLIPEPAALALFGLGGVLLRRRRL